MQITAPNITLQNVALVNILLYKKINRVLLNGDGNENDIKISRSN